MPVPDGEIELAACTDVLRRATGDPTEPTAVLTALAQPLARSGCLPVRIAAPRHLADIAIDDHVRTAARAITANPHRITYFGGWRVFTEDEQLRTAASALPS
ncbi:hypothetical protein [Amycolatopsis alba]|uniref:Uncharacterized protein n=1 Tax=Amycolatopsis alba DSM 44262 TaxID=1125972 RepID=A0A229RR63_AMYAL|nr:hypothetical protein [Amycolatopsis alba]OXM48894.1 hypothetical protein CFP75_20780 [Amycolatopsis alba DSM 44262]